MALSYAALINCISAIIKVDSTVEWVLCPGSTNCVCPEGFTGQSGTAQPRCLKFASANLYCDPRTLIVEVRHIRILYSVVIYIKISKTNFMVFNNICESFIETNDDVQSSAIRCLNLFFSSRLIGFSVCVCKKRERNITLIIHQRSVKSKTQKREGQK